MVTLTGATRHGISPRPHYSASLHRLYFGRSSQLLLAVLVAVTLSGHSHWGPGSLSFAGPRHRPPVTGQAAARAVAQKATSDGASDASEAETVDRMMLKVLTPEGLALQTVVSELSLPGLEGRLGILRGHAHMIAPVAFGLLRYKRQGKWLPVVLHGGFASVENNVVTILSSMCERGSSIPSAEESKQLLDTSTTKLTQTLSRVERLEATQEIRLAAARLQAAALLSKEGG
ncbi:unnamed protein product [Polarella glacialis]|uniref:ATP synthase F1 complex delta/epsilon subunit N-terminal domain-containing protein n=1 Tax=Polarella glacialis TaxID=89957 RepID=A0A813HUH1_POLGL|nr:unnamed protein product [Polarella glacialis]